MAYLNVILIWLHMLALAGGVGGGFVMSMIGPAIASAAPEQRAPLGGLRRKVANLVTASLVVLLISGPLLVIFKFGGVGQFTLWFWVKMALVIVLLAMNIYSRMLLRRIEGGDMSVAGSMKALGISSGAVSLLIVLTAILAFS